MEEKELESYVNHHRWLINNGLANPEIQDNLYMYGILSHPEAKEVDVILDISKKRIDYVLFFEPRMINILDKFKALSSKSSLWSTFCLWRLLKKYGNLDLKSPLSRMIRDYCGPLWSISVEVKDVSEYKREFVERWSE